MTRLSRGEWLYSDETKERFTGDFCQIRPQHRAVDRASQRRDKLGPAIVMGLSVAENIQVC